MTSDTLTNIERIAAEGKQKALTDAGPSLAIAALNMHRDAIKAPAPGKSETRTPAQLRYHSILTHETMNPKHIRQATTLLAGNVPPDTARWIIRYAKDHDVETGALASELAGR